MNKKQLDKIIEMESILNEMNGMLEEANSTFEKWKSLRPKIKKEDYKSSFLLSFFWKILRKL